MCSQFLKAGDILYHNFLFDIQMRRKCSQKQIDSVRLVSQFNTLIFLLPLAKVISDISYQL